MEPAQFAIDVGFLDSGVTDAVSTPLRSAPGLSTMSLATFGGRFMTSAMFAIKGGEGREPLLRMGAGEVAEGEAILKASAIPTFEYPDTAARSFCYMWRYSDNLRAFYETPALAAGPTDRRLCRGDH